MICSGKKRLILVDKINGKIIKGIGGFYYVDTEAGLYECKARGKFRLDGITPLVGDNVTIQIDDESNKKGVIYEVLERKNMIYRPKVANLDKIILTFAPVNPKINFSVLDKFIILAEKRDIEVIICINKIDLASEGLFEDICEVYKGTGYKIIKTSAVKNEGIDNLKGCLRESVSVFAGPSGCGKTSLLNLVSSQKFKTGDISAKLKRGKHTTREAVLVTLNHNTHIVDTPGFTSMSLDGIEKEEIKDYFLEFLPYAKECKFVGCAHIDEEGCEVREHVGEGIHVNRYNSYKAIYEELKDIKPVWPRKD